MKKPAAALTLAIKMTIRRFGVPLLAMLAAGAAHAADCPDSKTAKDGFVLEMPGVRSEFRQLEESVVQVTNSFESSSPQTQFFFGGIVEVYRTSKTGQFAVLPFSDPRSVLPLKTGAHHKLSWVLLDAKESRAEHQSLELQVAGEETLQLGECKYKVLAFKQISKSAEGQELEAWTALYSPELQAVLAKRYAEGTVAYQSIKPLKK
jgi:hypothetical protein